MLPIPMYVVMTILRSYFKLIVFKRFNFTFLTYDEN